METTLIVGDLHLKQKLVLPQVEQNMLVCGAKRVVFLGDAVNDWYASDQFEIEAMQFYADWVLGQRKKGVVVDVLLGNHDFCYIKGIEDSGTHYSNIPEVSKILREQLQVKVATTVGEWLCTHAGVTQRWAQKYLKSYRKDSAWSAFELAEALNYILEEKPRRWNELYTVGHARGGWDEPSPLWADLSELSMNPAYGLKQIVGHTPVNEAFHRKNEFKGNEFEIWGCDTLSVYGSNLEPIGNGYMLLATANSDGGCDIEVVPFNKNDELAWRDACWEYARRQGICGVWW